MPLYEYECAKCGEKIEVIRSFSDPPLVVCPECGGALTKLLSSPAFQFKGSGFYLTDYGKSGEKSSSKGEEGKGGSESKSDSAGESRKREDSSKGKKEGDGGGPSNAAASSPPAPAPPAPSKKKDTDTK